MSTAWRIQADQRQRGSSRRPASDTAFQPRSIIYSVDYELAPLASLPQLQTHHLRHNPMLHSNYASPHPNRRPTQPPLGLIATY